MSIPTLEYFVLAYFALVTLFDFTEPCPDPWCPTNSTGHLEFSDTINKISYARAGHSKTFHCCAYGYDKIEWYKNMPSGCEDSSGWLPFPWGAQKLERCEQNQTLRLNIVSSTKCIKGLYKCVAKNTTTGKKIEQTINLKVMVCDNIPRPIFTEKPTDQYLSVGSEDVKINCAGYYGCAKDNPSPVWWRQIIHIGDMIEERDLSYLDGFTENRTNSTETQIYESIITIKKVKREFIGIQLKCLLGANLLNVPNAKITLFEKVTPKNYGTIAIILSVVCGTILLALLACIVTYKACGPYITFTLRRLVGRLPKRGECEFDGIVIATEEDYPYVTSKLYPVLEKERNYKIHFPERDITCGKAKLEELAKYIRKCYTVLIVYSRSFVENSLQSYIFEMITTERPGNIIIILYESIPRELHREMEEEGRSVQQQKIALKVFTKIRWPGDECKNERKLRNFWSALCQKLPYVDGQNKGKGMEAVIRNEPRDSALTELLRNEDKEWSTSAISSPSSTSDDVFPIENNDSVEFRPNNAHPSTPKLDTAFRSDRDHITAQAEVHIPEVSIDFDRSPTELLQNNATFALDFSSLSSETSGQVSDVEGQLSPSYDPHITIPISRSSQKPAPPMMTQASADSGYSSVQSSGNLQSFLNNQNSFEEKVNFPNDCVPLIETK